MCSPILSLECRISFKSFTTSTSDTQTGRFGGHCSVGSEYPGLRDHTMRHIHRLLQQCLDQAIRDGLIAGTSPERFSIHSKEGQRQCADTSRSGGLSGHKGVDADHHREALGRTAGVGGVRRRHQDRQPTPQKRLNSCAWNTPNIQEVRSCSCTRLPRGSTRLRWCIGCTMRLSKRLGWITFGLRISGTPSPPCPCKMEWTQKKGFSDAGALQDRNDPAELYP